jgi:uracil phosphoribosyltransferase
VHKKIENNKIRNQNLQPLYLYQTKKMVHHLSKDYSLICEYINELRDVNVQTDRMRFRKNMFRIGQLVAYELSKHLAHEATEVETPMGIYSGKKISAQPVVGTILRAGVPLFEGILDVFDKADCSFIAAYRKHAKDDSFTISQEYVTCPELEGRTLIIADPMLATGASLVEALKELKTYGEASSTHIICAIASQLGLELVHREFPNVHIWVADIDDELTAKGYIVPGLGDAGDLSYGSKMQF